MKVNIDLVEGSYPNFGVVESFNGKDGSFSFAFQYDFFKNRYNLNDICYCQLKLFSKKDDNSYEFLDEYNNEPSKYIQKYKHLIVSYDNARKCLCNCSKKEIINLLQKSMYHENKNKNEIEDLKHEINNIDQKFNQTLNIKKKKEKEIVIINEEKSKLENDCKRLNNEIKQLVDENSKSKKEIEVLNNEIKKLNVDKSKYKKDFDELNEQIKKSNIEKSNIEKEYLKLNNEIKKLKEEKAVFEKEKIGLNNEIKNLNVEKAKFEKENLELIKKIEIINNEKSILEKDGIRLNNDIKKMNQEISKLRNECQGLNNIIKQLKDEKTIFGNKFKDLNNEIKILKDEKNNLQELKQKDDIIINNIKKQFKEEIDILNKERIELENKYKEKINLLINENQNLNKNILKLKKDIEIQKKDNENNFENYKKNNNELHIQEINKLKKEHNDEMNQSNEKYNKLIKEYNDKINQSNEKYNKLEKEAKLLANVDPGLVMMLRNKGIVNLINQNSNTITIDQENRIKLNKETIPHNEVAEDFYDLIVDIKSIKDIDKGWDLKMNERGLKNYLQYAKEEVIVIGVIGNSNKGKSFILQKLTQLNLLCGPHIRTEGLSVKYPELEGHENRKIVLLDSAGLETPVLNNGLENNENKEKNPKEIDNKDKGKKETSNGNIMNEEENKMDENNEKDKTNEFKEICEKYFREKSKEKNMTELFLQNYIMTNSTMLILVVGILTFSEQKLITRIKAEMKDNKIKKPLFIIHNLILYDTVEKIENHIKNVLLKCITFKLKLCNNIGIGSSSRNGGAYYEENTDPPVYHLILANDLSPAGEHYNLFTLKFLLDYFGHFKDLKGFDLLETLKENFVSLSQNYFENRILKNDLMDKEAIIKSKKIGLTKKENEKNNIQLKNIYTDELGFSNFKSTGFVPKYNYFVDKNNICVRIEVPGNITISHEEFKHSREYTIIPIVGEKIKDNTPENDSSNKFSSREFGKFHVDIFLPNDQFLLKHESVDPQVVNGVAMFNFPLETIKIESKKVTLNDI